MPPQFLSVMPGFAVSDLNVALAFYIGMLGFQTVMTNGPAHQPTFALLKHGPVEITLMVDPGVAGTGACYFKLEGIDQFYAALLAQGVVMTHSLRTEEYEMREFQLADPDGNLINFGEYVGE